MWTLRKSFTFDAAHFIPGHQLCGSLHGHTYELTLEFSGYKRDSFGFLVDFDYLHGVVWPFLSINLDHKNINETTNLPTTSVENLSRWIYEELKKCLPLLAAATVKEGKHGEATWRG